MTSKKYRDLLGGPRASHRKTDTRPIKKLFIIITEGETEKAYFTQEIFDDTKPHSAARVQVICKKSRGGTDPRSVLTAMKDELVALQKKKEIRSGDPAWIVIDADNSSAAEFADLDTWVAKRSDRFVAYTKPQFEWWLLLHYRDGAGVVTQSDCMSALKREDSNYRKGARFSITDEQVEEALERANRLHISRDATLVDLHERPGAVTTVHFLVQDLLNAIR
jgi:hypothetical protein